MLETTDYAGLAEPGSDDPQPNSDVSNTAYGNSSLRPFVGASWLNSGLCASLGPGLLGDLSGLKTTDAADRNIYSPVGFPPSYLGGCSRLGPGLLDAGLALLSDRAEAKGVTSQPSLDGAAPVMTTSPQGRAMIKSFEGGVKLRPYTSVEDSTDTVGIGHKIQPGETFSRALEPGQSDALYDADIKTAENWVKRAMGPTPLTQNQFDALVSFAFSTPSAFDPRIPNNSFLPLLRSGNLDGAANRMILYDVAGGKPSMGVQRRRLHE